MSQDSNARTNEYTVPLRAFALLRRSTTSRLLFLTVALAFLVLAALSAFERRVGATFLVLLWLTVSAFALWMALGCYLAIIEWAYRRRKRDFYVRFVVSQAAIRAVDSLGRETRYEFAGYRGWELRHPLTRGPALRSVVEARKTRKAPVKPFTAQARELELAGPGTFERFVADAVEASGLPRLRRRWGNFALQLALLPAALLGWLLIATALGVASEPMVSPAGLRATIPGGLLLIAAFYAMVRLQKHLYEPR